MSELNAEHKDANGTEWNVIGCGEQMKFFGAPYEDGLCINGYMWDLDSCAESGGDILLNGGDEQCPNCWHKLYKEASDEKESQ